MKKSERETEKIHLELSKMLISIDEICRENRIRYYITAGTLLGAVREGGFIPWDDDCDVVIPRRDFCKFVKIMQKRGSDFFYFQDSRCERHYPFAFAKIRSKRVGGRESGVIWQGLGGGCYIDVFPLDKCPENTRRATRFFKLSELFTSLLVAKCGGECGYKKRSARLIFSLLSLLHGRVIALFREAVRIYYSMTSNGARLATVYGSYGYPRECYEAEWFSEECRLKFEGHTLSAPVGYEEILKSMYGDYMTPHAESERRAHFAPGKEKQ